MAPPAVLMVWFGCRAHLSCGEVGIFFLTHVDYYLPKRLLVE
jgi:hypothetical protein